MLLYALRDVAHGRLSDREEAGQWIEGPESAHYAEQLGIKAWPPGEDCYNRLRRQYEQRCDNARGRYEAN
jgi:hypothetical protein